MNMVLSIYTKGAFKEYLLPSVNNADYTITLHRDYFQLKEDLQLNLEVLYHHWHIKKNRHYYISNDVGARDGEELRDGDVIQLRTIRQESIAIIAKRLDIGFHAYDKFSLKNIESLQIGSDPENDIVYNYRGMVSKRHAKILRDGAGFKIQNSSSNGVFVNASRVDEEIALRFGDYINILGLHMVFLGDALAIDMEKNGLTIDESKLVRHTYDEDATVMLKAREATSPGKTLYHRAPRNYERIQVESIEIEEPPQPARTKQQPLYMTIGPSVTMALPMILGCMMMVYASGAMGGSSLYMYSGLVMSVSSALVAVVWAVVNIRVQKKEESKQEAYRLQTYGEYLVEKTEEVKEKYERTIRQLKEVYQNVEHCLKYDEKSRLLWSRNRTHSDFLTHRLGLGDIPFQVTLDIPKKKFTLYKDELAEKPAFIKENYETLYQVPITLNLVEKNLIGIIGGKNKKGAIEIAKALSGQIAANNCYTDVKMAFLYNGASSADYERWAFAKWLPHVWSKDKKSRYIASNSEEASDVLYDLTGVFRMRMEENTGYGEKTLPKPYYVLFISDIAMLEGELLSKYIFSGDAACGLTTILLAERYEDLPNQCDFIIENTDSFCGMYEVSDAPDERQKIEFDQVDEKQLERFSRHLSSLRVREIEEGGEIPNSLTFFEMLGVNRPEELPVKELWAKNRTYENIRGVIGAKAGGAPCYLDVHEKYHGPHGLVAGTTGSGKSETLQTYLLSLAVNYSPDDIGIFIIDYKGGGMANLFEGLPHMVGQISNLSGNQVRRAMVSIKSENRRRQRIFTENGVNNINLYTKLYKSGEAAIPIPHLFIIIDEFAELKREEPDFMKELISVAQVGRSLGVHLILATQKPSGTVDDNIWSNSKFRLCLRVQDQQDSKDMLHKPDAAFITQAGRCYLQVGNDEVFELFQSGFSGAVYDEDDLLGNREIVELISTTGKVEMSGISIKRAKKKNAEAKKKNEKTQLDAVKEHLAAVAKENGYDHEMMLWMPVLSDHIYLDELEGYSKTAFSKTGWKKPEGAWSLEIMLGMMDDPENQNQMPLKVDLAKDGNVVILGNIVSGKSTMMQTFIYALIQKYTPEYINVYGLDFSSKSMAAFEPAPHVGGIMYETDTDKIGKFFNMLDGILKERKKLLRGGNFEQYVRVNGPVIPAIVIFIDNYGALKAKTNEAYEEQLIRLSKEGVSHGIFMVISGKEFGLADITSAVGDNMNTVLCLAMQDKYAYADHLHNTQFEVLPEAGIKGRGLACYGKRILEYQTALAIEAENDYERLEHIQKVCEKMASSWHGSAKAVPEIPEKPVWSEFMRLDDFHNKNQMPDQLAVGYNAADASIYGIPLRESYCYMIYGAERTGKTNFLKICVQAALQKNSQVCVIDSPDGSLKSFAGNDRVLYASDEQSVFDLFTRITPIFKARNQVKNQMLSEGYEEDEIFDVISKEIPYFIFIADFAWFVPFIYNAELDMRGFLETIIAKGRLHHIYFISELSLKKRAMITGYEIYESFAGYKTGIHFGGKVSENPVLSFDYLPFAQQTKAEKVGVGILPAVTDEQQASHIVVPLAGR